VEKKPLDNIFLPLRLEMKNFLTELRRRNVFKMAVLFAVGGWAVLSVSDLVLDIFGAPEGSLRIIFFVLVASFPIALFLSWFYEITPEGLKREVDVQPSESIRSETGRKMNFMIALSILLVVAGMAIQYFIFSESGGLEAIEKNSIAVLPFVDMSPEGDQEYFGDGIAEELLNLLAKMPELQVAARTSSFSSKARKKTSRPSVRSYVWPMCWKAASAKRATRSGLPHS
jgi:adenylate cyclase